MIVGKATKLTSQFRLTYNMILNLFRLSGEFQVEDMIRRSFSESPSQKALELKKQSLKATEAQLRDIEDIICVINPKSKVPPIFEYYKVLSFMLTLIVNHH